MKNLILATLCAVFATLCGCHHHHHHRHQQEPIKLPGPAYKPSHHHTPNIPQPGYKNANPRYNNANPGYKNANPRYNNTKPGLPPPPKY